MQRVACQLTSYPPPVLFCALKDGRPSNSEVLGSHNRIIPITADSISTGNFLHFGICAGALPLLHSMYALGRPRQPSFAAPHLRVFYSGRTGYFLRSNTAPLADAATNLS